MSSKRLQNFSPAAFLQNLTGKQIIVKLKWGNEYKGFLVSYDPYFNIQLSGCEEYLSSKHVGTLGDVVIRCNNVLYIREGAEMSD